MQYPHKNMVTSLMKGEDDEGRLLKSIYRSRVQAQGTCVVNSGGQVLAWTVMYDKNQSVLDFLGHSLKRYREHPDAKEPILTERYMKFPSHKLEDFKEEARLAPIAERHPEGKSCQAQFPVPEGHLNAWVFGRALDKKGNFLSTVNQQEHFAMERFTVTPETQDALAKLFAGAGAGRVRLPGDFARQCVASAYLGNTETAPLATGGSFKIKDDLKQCEFWAQQVADAKAVDGKASLLLRVEGQSEVMGKATTNVGQLLHEVTLTWEGFIEMKGGRMTRLLLAARGNEILQYGEKLKSAPVDEVAILAGGRFIDMECAVRYGIIGEHQGTGSESRAGMHAHFGNSLDAQATSR
jgi:hypothetical protein